MYYSFIYAGTLVINNIGTGSKIQKQSKVMMFIVVVKVIKVRWCSNFGRQIYLYLFFICSIHDPPMSGNSFLSHHSSPLVESHRLFREQCEYLFFSRGCLCLLFPAPDISSWTYAGAIWKSLARQHFPDIKVGTQFKYFFLWSIIVYYC